MKYSFYSQADFDTLVYMICFGMYKWTACECSRMSNVNNKHAGMHIFVDKV